MSEAQDRKIKHSLGKGGRQSVRSLGNKSLCMNLKPENLKVQDGGCWVLGSLKNTWELLSSSDISGGVYGSMEHHGLMCCVLVSHTL
jgi:hypothetical protein